MTRPHPARPGNPRRWHRARGLAALAVPFALAAGVLPASGTALAQPTAPATTPTSTPATTTAPAGTAGSADQHQAQHQAQPLSLPGLHDGSYSVTLLTGDQIRLTAVGVGRYMVVATPATGHDTVTVNATGGPDGVTTLQAAPSAAQFLIASGQVDTGLFDIQYLAAHGYTDGANKPIPVTVQYVDHPTADTMTRRAGSLPASTVAATDTQAGSTDLRVDPQHVADFWAALTNTGKSSARQPGSAGLANGIAHVWLTGHRTSDQPVVRPAAGQPTYPLTVTMTLKPGALGGARVVGCNFGPSTMCPLSVGVFAVDGDNAGRNYPANWMCVDRDPCTTMRARADVPAGSYMVKTNSILFWLDAYNEYAWAVAPQVEVNGPTDVEFDLSRLRHIDIDTPKPTETYNAMIQWKRTLPDGRYLNSIDFAAYGQHSTWVLPSDQRVTTGAFHFATAWVLGKPPITAHVDGPKGFDLHPMYPFYNAGSDDPVVRFSGQRRLQVVNAGNGQAEDFTAIDARGKVVIMRTMLGHCEISEAQLDNAVKAGAAGVLIDTRTPLDSVCRLPIYFKKNGISTPPDMPFAAIPLSEATRLESLLGHGDVRVTVTDNGQSPYMYHLKFYDEGGMPGSPHYDIDNDQLTAIDDRLHADTPSSNNLHDVGAWRPDEFLIGGAATEHVTWPTRRTEYYGPVSPDVVYHRSWTGSGILGAHDVFDQRGDHLAEDNNARPASPGPFTYNPKVPAAQPPDRFAQPCALCRQGNALSPLVNLNRGSVSDQRNLSPDTSQLYLGDEEIPQTMASSGHPAYALPPEEHTYRLVTDYDNAGYGHTHADWTFTSAAPDHNQVPPGILCRGEAGKPCQADPIVFLSYDLGVALDNTLSAPSVGMFTVTASHQATDAPAIRDLKVWTSTDDGGHWKPALVLPRGRGGHGARDFSVLTGVPWLSQTTGTLSIKAQATDAQGNSVTETLTQAVKLTARTGWGWPGHRIWQ